MIPERPRVDRLVDTNPVQNQACVSLYPRDRLQLAGSLDKERIPMEFKVEKTYNNIKSVVNRIAELKDEFIAKSLIDGMNRVGIELSLKEGTYNGRPVVELQMKQNDKEVFVSRGEIRIGAETPRED